MQAREAYESRTGSRPLFVASGHDDATQRPVLGVSEDGITFRRITPFNYTPPPGDGCRDCSLLYHRGRYYLAYTASGFGLVPYFGIAVSDDLVNWTHHVDVATPLEGTWATWAPEWCVDGGAVHLLFSKPDQNGRWSLYHVTAADETLTAWTALAPVGGTDTWHSKIDAQVIRHHHQWLLVCRNYSGNGALLFRSTTSPVGGYSLVNTPDWGVPQEGQCLTDLGGGALRLYFIRRPGEPGQAMSFGDTADGGMTFGPMQTVTSDMGTPHMSVFGFTGEEVPPLALERSGGAVSASYSSAGNFIMEGSTDLRRWETVSPRQDAGGWRVTAAAADGPARFWRLRRPY